MQLPTRILVPTDFSDHATAALDYAVALGACLGATVHVAHVVMFPSLGTEYLSAAGVDALLSGAQVELDRLVAARASRVTMAPPILLTGDARDEIDAAARTIGADLLVIGTHGRRGVSRLLLGSVAEAIARTAPCPVLLVRDGAAAR